MGGSSKSATPLEVDEGARPSTRLARQAPPHTYIGLHALEQAGQAKLSLSKLDEFPGLVGKGRNFLKWHESRLRVLCTVRRSQIPTGKMATEETSPAAVVFHLKRSEAPQSLLQARPPGLPL